MFDINLFVEDFGHEAFLDALLQRLMLQYHISVTWRFESSRGGHGVVIDELKTYIRDLRRGRKRLPDMIIVATDGNCKGFLERKRQIDEVVKSFSGLVIVPYPTLILSAGFFLTQQPLRRFWAKDVQRQLINASATCTSSF